MFRSAGPDFLAVDDVFVAFLAGEGAQCGGVGTAGRFGDAERLQAELPGSDFGQVGLFLLVRAVAEDGAHDIHLGVAGGTVAALALDGFQDGGGGRQGQAGAAEFLGDQRAEIAAFGQGADEFGGVGLVPDQIV